MTNLDDRRMAQLLTEADPGPDLTEAESGAVLDYVYRSELRSSQPAATEQTDGLSRRFFQFWAAATVAVAIGGGLLILASRSPSQGVDATDETSTTIEGRPDVAAVVPPGVQRLAPSIVNLVGLDDDLQPVCSGSGVVVGSGGLILTNAHAVTSGGRCRFSSMGVADTADITSPAELRHNAVVLAIDAELDLAVVRIEGLFEGLSAAPLGDGTKLEVDDEIHLLSHPPYGTAPITRSAGRVIGFASPPGTNTPDVITTDILIPIGTGGAIAADADGRVVGILADAGTGSVVRPIDLARPLLDAASTADPIGAVVELPKPQPDTGSSPNLDPDVDPVASRADNPRFSLARGDDREAGRIRTAQAGIEQLCLSFDWTAPPGDENRQASWFLNGELQVTHPLSGASSTICLVAPDRAGLPAGVYEVGVFEQGWLLFVEGIEITSDPVEMVAVEWINSTGADVCGLAINPMSTSGQVGLNELGQAGPIAPGERRTIELPTGEIIAEATDCAGDSVSNAFAGLTITEPVAFHIAP